MCRINDIRRFELDIEEDRTIARYYFITPYGGRLWLDQEQGVSGDNDIPSFVDAIAVDCYYCTACDTTIDFWDDVEAHCEEDDDDDDDSGGHVAPAWRLGFGLL